MGDIMKFLITGFEPFYTNKTNPSGDALNRLKDDDVDTLLLPVSYLKVRELLENKIKTCKPDVVISLGLAQGRKCLTFELDGINYRKCSIPDNEGYQTNGELINPKGKDAYFTKFDLHSLIKSLKEINITSDISVSAGAYVCNTVYYNILEMQEIYGYKALFIHLPGEEALSLENDIKALKAIIKEIKKA